MRKNDMAGEKNYRTLLRATQRWPKEHLAARWDVRLRFPRFQPRLGSTFIDASGPRRYEAHHRVVGVPEQFRNANEQRSYASRWRRFSSGSSPCYAPRGPGRTSSTAIWTVDDHFNGSDDVVPLKDGTSRSSLWPFGRGLQVVPCLPLPRESPKRPVGIVDAESHFAFIGGSFGRLIGSDVTVGKDPTGRGGVHGPPHCRTLTKPKPNPTTKGPSASSPLLRRRPRRSAEDNAEPSRCSPSPRISEASAPRDPLCPIPRPRLPDDMSLGLHRLDLLL